MFSWSLIFLGSTLLWCIHAAIHSLHISDGSRDQVISRLADAQARCPRYRVLDVGAAMNPWTLGVVTAVADRTPNVVDDCFEQAWFSANVARFCCRSGPRTTLKADEQNISCFTPDYGYERCCRNGEPQKLLRFDLDVNKESAWEPLLQHVNSAGKFEFAVASHIIEDVMNPEILLQMLPRVAKRGFVSMPSKFTELKRGVEGYGPHRGHIHHRWIGTIQSGRLLLLPKLSFLETVEGSVELVGNALTADSIDMSFEWEDDLPFSILNEGFVGPTPIHVIQMYLEVFRTSDDVDEAYIARQPMLDLSPLPCEARPKPKQKDAPPQEESGVLTSVQFCSLSSFEGLSKQLAAQLGATGEPCFHRELQEVRQRCLIAMKAVEAAMMIYHTCAAEPVEGSSRMESCKEAANLKQQNSSAILAACMQEEGPEADAVMQSVFAAAGAQARSLQPEALKHRAKNLRCARAASLVRPEENHIPMDVPLECLSHPFKVSFYNDLARHFAELPWISLRHPFLPYYDKSIFVEFAQSVPTWVAWLFELWYFYDHIFLPMFREQHAWGAQLAPLFRLPPWAVPRGIDRRQLVLEHLVEMLAESRTATKSKRVAMAEVGVFMGDTSAALLTKRLPLETVHLVDPWDSNDVFKATVIEKRGELTSAEARRHVEQRFAPLAATYCFDGQAGIHRPYQGQAVPRSGPWKKVERCGGAVEDKPGTPRVGIHATRSVAASKRVLTGSLDLVFIDGAHDYDSVSQDLKAWWPKIRPGGVMAGHDFSMSFPGLMRAVLEFVSMLPGRTEVYLDTDYSFWFFKPEDLPKRHASWRPRLEGGTRGHKARARVS
ncbi:unnamed protein product [Durusdinium trenchii]|uniref:Uncharacterized protein n=1 Tax=Durusdinium trenchii TaxID=1381693 RepID=A0ABP0HC72_9DINO